MIDIAPILTPSPIPKIKKIIRDEQKSPKQRQSQQNEESKEDESTEIESQHIDEIV